MTISELIDGLQKLDGGMDVIVQNDAGDDFEPDILVEDGGCFLTEGAPYEGEEAEAIAEEDEDEGEEDDADEEGS